MSNKGKKDDGADGGADKATTATAAATGTGKKKAAPKPRKRKASDAGTTTKSGGTPAKKAAAEDKAERATGDKGSSGGGPATGDHHAPAPITLKPFVKGELTESIKHMLFGFGDENEPLAETAELMEDLVVEYVQCMTKKAMEMSTIKGKLDTECFIFLIRKDPERYERIKELLRANDELRAVLNSGFDPSDEKMY